MSASSRLPDDVDVVDVRSAEKTEAVQTLAIRRTPGQWAHIVAAMDPLRGRLVLGPAQDPQVTVDLDTGRVHLHHPEAVDDAAVLFWQTVERMVPRA